MKVTIESEPKMNFADDMPLGDLCQGSKLVCNPP